MWISDMHAQIISSIKDLQLDGEDPRKLLQSWGRLRFPRHLLQWVGPDLVTVDPWPQPAVPNIILPCRMVE